MKRLFGLTLMFLMLATNAALAHPPKTIDIKVSGTKLDVSVYHKVKNSIGHFMYKISVKVNGKLVIVQEFSMQTGNGTDVSYVVPSLKMGDVIELEAFCNNGGQKRETISVEIE